MLGECGQYLYINPGSSWALKFTSTLGDIADPWQSLVPTLFNDLHVPYLVRVK